MKKMFPMMIEKPDAHIAGSGVAYWFFAYFFWPSLISLSVVSPVGLSHEAWVEIGYHLLNFLIVLFFFHTYLKEAFLTVQISTKQVLGTAAVCAAAIVVLKVAMWILFAAGRNELFAQMALDSLLTTEADLLYFSTALIGDQPLWGTLCLVILTPVTISCLYYASVFAPICTKRPWLAYLLMAVLPVLPRLSLAFCLWPIEQEMAIYLVQLPVHMIACWSYQKTDTVWTPILVHFMSNLVLAMLMLWVFGIM